MNAAFEYFPIIAVPENAWNETEQIGTKFKFWFTDADDIRTMFKEGRPGHGENWAEKISNELCNLINLPCAVYQFATWRGREGVITPTLVPNPNVGRLVLGNEVLYPRQPDVQKFYQRKNHTVRIVVGVMRHPLLSRVEIEGVMRPALDQFVGYLALDAWVGNQDRHDQNWALIRDSQGTRLAPTFDHASSLGRNESDEKRKERLQTKDRGFSIDNYVKKAASALFSTSGDTKPLSTIDAFISVAKFSPNAGKFWIEKITQVTDHDIIAILDKVPPNLMSEISREFAFRMLQLNQLRLKEAVKLL